MTNCVKCGGLYIVRNGKKSSNGGGFVQCYVCRECKHKWSGIEIHEAMLRHTHYPVEPTLRAFELVAWGLHLREVEIAIGSKSETISKKLLKCFQNVETWADVSDRLLGSGMVTISELEVLTKKLRKISAGQKDFHSLRRGGPRSAMTKQAVQQRVKEQTQRRLLKRP